MLASLLALNTIIAWATPLIIQQRPARAYTRQRIEPPATSIKVEASAGVTVRTVDAQIAYEPNGVAAVVILELATRSRALSEVTVPVVISSDVRVTGMAVAIAGERTLVGQWAPPDLARDLYTAKVRTWKDPGLLELAADTGDAQQLRLRVYPLASTKPARVYLFMFLPGGNELRLYNADRRVMRWRLTATEREVPVLPDTRVTARLSLVALDPARVGDARPWWATVSP